MELKYKIRKRKSQESSIVYGSDNVFYCLLEFIYNTNIVKQSISEESLHVCEQAQEWCEQAEIGGKFYDEDFTIEVISE